MVKIRSRGFFTSPVHPSMLDPAVLSSPALHIVLLWSARSTALQVKAILVVRRASTEDSHSCVAKDTSKHVCLCNIRHKTSCSWQTQTHRFLTFGFCKNLLNKLSSKKHLICLLANKPWIYAISFGFKMESLSAQALCLINSGSKFILSCCSLFSCVCFIIIYQHCGI